MAPAVSPAATFFASWSTLHSYALVSALTILCLLPFCGRAFHVDDPLFIWAAKNIVRQPLNPYGFQLIWDRTRLQLSEITQNPPLASYYAALTGSVFGWSEWALHLSFLLITLLLTLGTYRLAAKFTRFPLLAALATLLTPGVLVSASSVMCDTMMLALWVWASIFWIEGLQPRNYRLLVLASLLVGASALTKYFAIALIPLLLAYSLFRLQRTGAWAYFLLIPAAILVAYQVWTKELYGHGLLLGAAEFAQGQRADAATSWPAMAIVGASFAGGCALSSATFAPFVWSRGKMTLIAVVSLFATLLVMLGWADLGLHVGGKTTLDAFYHNWPVVTGQLALCVFSGVSLLAMAIGDYWEDRDAGSVFLALWVLGTFIFAAFVNYTVNARSVLPLIPPAGILIARRVEKAPPGDFFRLRWKVAIALLVSGGVSLIVSSADAGLANSARQGAALVVGKTRGKTGNLWFEGHWGFQYYMEQSGAARPLDFEHPEARPGDLVAIPLNNIQLVGISPQMIGSREEFDLHPGTWASTIDSQRGAGFYSSYWGPLPFVIGPAQSEHYSVLQLVAPHTP